MKEARAEAGNLYDALERVLDRMGGIATDASQDPDLWQLLSDTVMVAEDALATMERHGMSNGERYTIHDEESFQIMRRYCYDRRNILFSVDTLRVHLEHNGVVVCDLDDEVLMEEFDALAPRILAEIKNIHQINMTRYVDGMLTAFCEIEQSGQVVTMPESAVHEYVEPVPVTEEIVVQPAVTFRRKILRPVGDGNNIETHTANIQRCVDLDKLENAVKEHLLSNVVSVARGEAVKFLSARSSQFSEDEIEAALSALVENGTLYRYREGGRSWFTFDSDLADTKREAYRAARAARKENSMHEEGEIDTEEIIDFALAERVLGVFIGRARHVQQMLTVKEVWLAMWGEVNIDERAFTADSARDIRDVARKLSDVHLMVTDTRGQSRGALSRSASQRVFKVGLKSQAVKETLQATQSREGTIIPLLKRYMDVEAGILSAKV